MFITSFQAALAVTCTLYGIDLSEATPMNSGPRLKKIRTKQKDKSDHNVTLTSRPQQPNANLAAYSGSLTARHSSNEDKWGAQFGHLDDTVFPSSWTQGVEQMGQSSGQPFSNLEFMKQPDHLFFSQNYAGDEWGVPFSRDLPSLSPLPGEENYHHDFRYMHSSHGRDGQEGSSSGTNDQQWKSNSLFPDLENSFQDQWAGYSQSSEANFASYNTPQQGTSIAMYPDTYLQTDLGDAPSQSSTYSNDNHVLSFGQLYRHLERQVDLAALRKTIYLGHEWENSRELCYTLLRRDVLFRIVDLISREGGLEPQSARAKLKARLTPLLALSILSGNPVYYQEAVYSTLTQKGGETRKSGKRAYRRWSQELWS
jgi:hypothetical protein